MNSFIVNIMKKFSLRFLTLCPLLLSGMTTISAAPITFNTALPVAKGQFLLREQLVISQSGNDPSAANRDRREIAAVSALGYGISRHWAAFAVLPYRDIVLKLDSTGQRSNRQNRGIGDLSLFTRYTAYQRDRQGETLRIAPFLGIKVPTGDNKTGDQYGTLPPPVQTGSGSQDYFGGVVLTWQTLRYQFDGQISYRANNEADGFEAGDILRLDGSYQHRLWRSNTNGIPDYLYGVIEVNFIHQDKNRISGREDPNSNGERLFLAPGMQYVSKRWIIEASVQLPLRQRLHGTALENDYILRSGFRFNF